MLLKDLKIVPRKEIAIKDVKLGDVFKIDKLEIQENENVYHVFEVINGNKYFYKIKESLVDNINFELVRI